MKIRPKAFFCKAKGWSVFEKSSSYTHPCGVQIMEWRSDLTNKQTRGCWNYKVGTKYLEHAKKWKFSWMYWMVTWRLLLSVYKRTRKPMFQKTHSIERHNQTSNWTINRQPIDQKNGQWSNSSPLTFTSVVNYLCNHLFSQHKTFIICKNKAFVLYNNLYSL